ncbi:hypothetical protein AB0C04_16170 [Micromonospora sp. NPDC048909]|uniref:hypothetical protein n=1 Tax=Micromonospora sp. NPDC048909 TaxID=3155643 RepID=UPI003401E296
MPGRGDSRLLCVGGRDHDAEQQRDVREAQPEGQPGARLVSGVGQNLLVEVDVGEVRPPQGSGQSQCQRGTRAPEPILTRADPPG